MSTRESQHPASSGSEPPYSPNTTAGAYLTVEEAAAYLSVRPSTVRAWVREGRMPCFRLGPRATRFTVELLDEFAASRLDRGSPF